MVIVDNRLQVAQIRLAYILSVSIATLLVLYSLFANSYADGQTLSLIFGIVLSMVFLYLLIIKPEYVYFAIQNNNKLIVRNYTAFPMFRKYKSYEIQLSTLYDYEIKRAFFNRLIFIRIIVKKNNQTGNYPWLSLSALPNKDLKKLTESLDKLVSLEKRKNK
jgi:hypothetical protein